MSEIRFEGADGLQSFADGVAVLLEGGLVFRSVDDNLAAQAVAEGIKRGSLFAFFGARAGRELRISATSGELGCGHFEYSSLG